MSKHTHYWLETGIPHDLVYLNSKWRFDCSVCDKKIWRRSQPVNPIVPSAWEEYNRQVAIGNAAYVMSPPLLSSEDQWSEGQRYKNIVQG